MAAIGEAYRVKGLGEKPIDYILAGVRGALSGYMGGKAAEGQAAQMQREWALKKSEFQLKVDTLDQTYQIHKEDSKQRHDEFLSTQTFEKEKINSAQDFEEYMSGEEMKHSIGKLLAESTLDYLKGQEAAHMSLFKTANDNAQNELDRQSREKIAKDRPASLYSDLPLLRFMEMKGQNDRDLMAQTAKMQADSAKARGDAQLESKWTLVEQKYLENYDRALGVATTWGDKIPKGTRPTVEKDVMIGAKIMKNKDPKLNPQIYVAKDNEWYDMNTYLYSLSPDEQAGFLEAGLPLDIKTNRELSPSAIAKNKIADELEAGVLEMRNSMNIQRGIPAIAPKPKQFPMTHTRKASDIILEYVDISQRIGDAAALKQFREKRNSGMWRLVDQAQLDFIESLLVRSAGQIKESDKLTTAQWKSTANNMFLNDGENRIGLKADYIKRVIDKFGENTALKMMNYIKDTYGGDIFLNISPKEILERSKQSR
jgi:hypothetical protein